MLVETRNVERLLAVGAVAMIHSEPHRKDGPRFKSTLRGWRKGAHLLLDRPRHESGAFAALNEGQPIVLRYLHDGQACAFDTQVMDWDTRKHAPYMRISWPEKIEFMSFRRYERVRVQIEAEMSVAGSAPKKVEIVDLSIGGCGVHTDVAVETESRVQLTFTLPEGQPVEGVKVVVKNCRPVKSGLFLGCEFTENQMAVESDVAFYVSRMVEMQRQESGMSADRRVLIIESNPDLNAKLRKQLERQHFDTVMAANLIDAFHRFRAAPPSAVVVNQQFSDLSGVEICRIIHHAAGQETLPVMVYGGEEGAFEEAALAAGACGVFPQCPSMAPDLAFSLSQKLGKVSS